VIRSTSPDSNVITVGYITTNARIDSMVETITKRMLRHVVTTKQRRPLPTAS